MGIKKLSNDEEKIMVKEYIDGAPVTVLIEKYGFKTKKTIIDKIKKYYPDNYAEVIKKARSNRKNYNIDLTNIDNEFNAYFLGLMLTDGYIQDKNKFGLQLADEDCISFIAKMTGNSYYTCQSNNKNHLTQYRIIFSDTDQINKMERLGIVRNKSRFLQPPQLKENEEKYIPYIIRGIIDGDGCIHTTSKGSSAFYICTMSKDFAYWIKNILEKTLHMKDIGIHQRHFGIWIVETALQSNIFKLIALVYDKPYGMKRKYVKLRETFRDYNLGNQEFLLG